MHEVADIMFTRTVVIVHVKVALRLSWTFGFASDKFKRQHDNFQTAVGLCDRCR